MKSFFLLATIVVINIDNAWCQQVSKSPEPGNVRSWSSGNHYLNDINARAARDFIQRFRLVEEAQWYTVKAGCLVRFKQDSVSCRVFYDNKGRWVYTIKWYGEKDLPRSVRTLVKRTWYDHTITQVDEVLQGNAPVVYIVHMEDATSWINVRICEQEITETTEYVKAGK
jgi:hypothetical protein